MEGITIDWETADRITCANLIEHRSMIKEHLEGWMNNGQYMHADDVVSNKERMDAFNVLIKYFGS